EDMLLLNPPLFGCDGGCSSVVPLTVALPPPLSDTTIVLEVRGRRSSVPDGAGNVVRSIIRKRNRLIAAPVLLVNFRRTEMVPKVELFGGSEVKSRTKFGDAVPDTPGSTSEMPMPGPLPR